MRKPIIIKYKQANSLIDGTIAYHGMVITANQQMAAALRSSGVSRYMIREVNVIMRILLPEWYEKTRKLEQFILLDEIIRNLKEASQEDKAENVFRAMVNNKTDLLNSISALVEIGAEPDALPAESLEQKIFQQIYETFLHDERSGIGMLRKRLERWNKAGTFKEELETNVMREGNKVLGVPPAVYFQGFYYITPLQSRLIDAYRRLEIPVYFLNNMADKEMPYEIWRKNPYFAEKMIVRNADEIGGRNTEEGTAPEIVEYRDDFALVRTLEKVSANDTVIYAVMSKQLKEILETFFPETPERDNMLAYPVGRYMLSLYNMWDDEEGLLLDPDNLRNCLATGWAGSRYEDSRTLLGTYDAVQDYFRSCRTLTDWQVALDRLQEVKEKIMPLYENCEGKKLGRWREVVTNPFHNLGAFSISREKLAQLTDAIRGLSEDARMLFAGSETLNLREHFRKVFRLLKDKAPREVVSEEEAAVLKIMLERMQSSPRRIKECHVSGLASAMTFFLGGKLKDESAGNDEEQLGPARGLSDIESASIMHPGKKIMICGCDSQNMPGQGRPYPWPLTRTYIESLAVGKEIEKRCRNYIHCMENILLANRYLFHLARQLKHVEFSWTELQHDKVMNPSVYLLQLKQKYGLKIKYIKDMLKDLPQEASYDGGECKLARQAMAVFASEETIWPEEIKMDQEFCPGESWRLFYDYILGNHPVFFSSFHTRFYMSILIALMADVGNCSCAEAAEQVFAAYPAFNEAERQETLDFAKRHKTNKLPQERQLLVGEEYTVKRHYLQYLSVRDVNNFLNGIAMSKEKARQMCKYCPHNACCFVKGRI